MSSYRVFFLAKKWTQTPFVTHKLFGIFGINDDLLTIILLLYSLQEENKYFSYAIQSKDELQISECLKIRIIEEK